MTPTNWIAGFWDTMYLTLRCPTVINISPYLLLIDSFPYSNPNLTPQVRFNIRKKKRKKKKQNDKDKLIKT
jgi:hypothetical protein